MMTKVGRVYQILTNLAEDGFYQTTQPELARLTGISIRQLYRITKDLEALGLIRNTLGYDQRGKRSGVIYELLSATGSPKGDSAIGHRESDSDLNDSAIGHRESDSKTIKGVTGLRESDSTLMNHDMNDKKQILLQLDFINAKNRKICATQVDLPTARRWRELWEYCENNDAWGEYGIATNGVGYIVRLIKNGDPVPEKIQSSLPAASLDISDIFRSRGLTQSEMKAPVENAILTSDGFWR